MNIIEFKDVAKSFFSQKLYSHVDFEINKGDKIAVVGNNGSGKSTLIRLINEDEYPDKGEVIRAENIKISCFDQFGKIDQDKDVRELLDLPFKEVMEAQVKLEELSSRFSSEPENYDELMNEYSHLSDYFESLGGYSYIHTQADFIDTFELGDKLDKKFGQLSGGEKQYIRLAIVLFDQCNLVILDEPLSFFDKKRTLWLSQYIKESRKAFLIISHNVDFIRGFANKILDVDNFTVTSYSSSYTDYVKKKKELIAKAKKINNAAASYIERMESAYEKKLALLEKCDNKHAQAVILRRMEREMEKLEKSKIALSKDYRYSFTEAPEDIFISSQDIDSEIVILKNLSKEFPGKQLYKNLNLTISRDTKIAIVGENGSGKSTLLRILTGQEEPSSGEIFINPKAKISVINQETTFPDENMSIIKYIKDKSGLSEDFIEVAVDTLYNDEPEFRDKRIFMLSGGEKKRLEIFANTLAEIDLLIVDEPSTYMDDYSRNAVATMLLDFPGAVIVVSHDKALLKKLDFTTYDIRDRLFRIKQSGNSIQE